MATIYIHFTGNRYQHTRVALALYAKSHIQYARVTSDGEWVKILYFYFLVQYIYIGTLEQYYILK